MYYAKNHTANTYSISIIPFLTLVLTNSIMSTISEDDIARPLGI